MLDKLSQYLILHQKANLPGIGVLTVEHLPARLDFINKTLHAPLPVIRFRSGGEEADGHFFNFVSAGLGEDKVAVIRKFNDLLFEIKQKLSSGSQIVLPNIGTLKKDGINTYSFQQQFSPEGLLAAVPALRVIRSNAQHTVLAGDTEHTSAQMQKILATKNPIKDRWVTYALILTAIGVAALVYYYFTNS